MRERDPADLVMKCDGSSQCLGLATRGIKLVVPPIGDPPPVHAYRPLAMMTTLHLCDAHARAVPAIITPAHLLGPREKQRLETAARERRGDGFKPDFEAARIEFVLTTTPEYRAFLASLGIARNVIAA